MKLTTFLTTLGFGLAQVASAYRYGLHDGGALAARDAHYGDFETSLAARDYPLNARGKSSGLHDHYRRAANSIGFLERRELEFLYAREEGYLRAREELQAREEDFIEAREDFLEEREAAGSLVRRANSASYEYIALLYKHLLPGQTYAVKEACKNPLNGIHCRLIVGKIVSNEGNFDWDATFYDIIQNEQNPKVAAPRNRKWTPAIGGESKYSPEFLGVAVKDPLAAQHEILAANPEYCYVGPWPGVKGNNCYSFVDSLWAAIKD